MLLRFRLGIFRQQKWSFSQSDRGEGCTLRSPQKQSEFFCLCSETAHSHCSFSSLYSVCPLRLHQNIIFIQDYKSMHPFSTSYLYLRDRRLSRDDQTSVYPATSSRFSGETPKNSVSPACPGLPTSLLSPGSELLILPLRPFRGSQGHVSRKQSQSFSHNL